MVTQVTHTFTLTDINVTWVWFRYIGVRAKTHSKTKCTRISGAAPAQRKMATYPDAVDIIAGEAFGSLYEGRALGILRGLVENN